MSDNPNPTPVNPTQEDDYFFRRDQELLTKLRDATAEKERHEALATATGVSDASLLNELDDLGVSVASLAAMSLVPMVLVAWCDGALDKKEKSAILKLAGAKGVADGSPAYSLLDHWLGVAPAADLTETWEQYMTAMLPKLSERARATLKEEVMDQCDATAKASGGMLGFGSISDAEEKTIARIAAAF